MKNLDINQFSKILDTVTRGYIQAIYFTDTGDSEQPDSDAEIAPSTVIQCFSDCCDFLAYCEKEGLLTEYSQQPGRTWDAFGIDFWLTRNGHGAGFWDRGLNELGDKLAAACKTFSSVDVYVGDDGLIYF